MSSQTDKADPLNLTGSWNGLYSYPSAREPVPFTAVLAENDSWLSGSTEETATAGKVCGQAIAATLLGHRSGNSVTFLKTYDDLPDRYDTVHYAGNVNQEGSEIEGRWTVPGSWSGKFLMIRARATEAVTSLDVAERV